MAHEFIVPMQIITGENALDMAKDSLQNMGKKALIVTDKGMIKLGNCQKVETVLQDAGIEYAVFSDILGEPTDTMIDAGLGLYQTEQCDFLIALGGGSALDSMKAIAALVANGGTIADYMGKIIGGNIPPMAAIPTTAGTGSEATQFTIITDTKKDVKMLLRGKVLMPNLAIIDPVFTMTVPPSITAFTGIDALCHAMEAYTSRRATSLSDTFAVSAVKRIFQSLPEAFAHGNHAVARETMATAALEAGIAFNNSSVTLIHGMSRPIGALFHVAHGLSNAMLIKECLTFALLGAYDRFGDLGKAIGVAKDTDSDQEASEYFLHAVIDLVDSLQIPTLQEYGINKEDFFAVIPKMAADALESGSPQNTRRDISKEEIEKMYARLWLD